MTTLLDIEARSGSGTGPAVDLGAAPLRALRLRLDVSALDGDRLTVQVETSDDGASWRPVGAPLRASDAGAVRASIGPVARHVRAAWVIAGDAPSATFGLGAEAARIYATPDDVFRLTLPEKALRDVSESSVIDALIAASGDADNEFGRVFTLPLLAWGDELTRRVCDVAAFLLLKHRGFNPESGTDQVVVKAYDDAMAWFRRVGDGRSRPSGIIDSQEHTESGGAPIVRSKPLRGW